MQWAGDDRCACALLALGLDFALVLVPPSLHIDSTSLEVDIAGAQKLSLASQIGTLALALRKAGDAEPTPSRPITLTDLMSTHASDDADDKGRFATIAITRAETRTLYSVPKDDRGAHAAATVGQGTMH